MYIPVVLPVTVSDKIARPAVCNFMSYYLMHIEIEIHVYIIMCKWVQANECMYTYNNVRVLYV